MNLSAKNKKIIIIASVIVGVLIVIATFANMNQVDDEPPVNEPVFYVDNVTFKQFDTLRGMGVSQDRLEQVKTEFKAYISQLNIENGTEINQVELDTSSIDQTTTQDNTAKYTFLAIMNQKEYSADIFLLTTSLTILVLSDDKGEGVYTTPYDTAPTTR